MTVDTVMSQADSRSSCVMRKLVAGDAALYAAMASTITLDAEKMPIFTALASFAANARTSSATASSVSIAGAMRSRR